MSSRIKVPDPFRSVPAGAYQPPNPSGPAGSAIDAGNARQNYEAFDRYFDIAPTSEISVYKTQKAWAGLDVYVNLPAYNYATGAGTLRMATLRVYAITRGNRSLVASGRVSATKDAGQGAVWVAAARCDADQFEVTWEADLFPSPQLPGVSSPQILVTCVASDRNTAIPAGLGQQVSNIGSLAIPQAMSGLHTATFTIPRMRICGVNAVNKVNAPRILQFRTTGSVGNPFAAFGMPAQGSPIFVETDGLFPGVPRYNQIIVDILTAAGTAGADGDVQWQFWFD